MRKRLTYTLAGALVTAAIVPAAVSAATNYSVTDIVVTKDGANYKVGMSTYRALVSMGKSSSLNIRYIKSSNGKTYTITQYQAALVASSGNVSNTMDKLNSAGTPTSPTVLDAKFDANGNLITNESSNFEVITIE